ncbi:MAG: TolC family protein [Candidatus Omnitrophica bacterium]|nr:TolC family protein [Candidatus Omnitrophota bacterium]MCM8827737.1 TolC family protein [Candidatus Omnitrophota bacterium]
MNEKKIFFFLAAGFLLLCGCSVSYYEKGADREVSSILKEKSKIAQKGKIISLQEDARNETIFLSLRDALIFAAKNNRAYKSAKEDVYLSALALTYQRYLYGLQRDASGTIKWNSADGEEKISGNLNLSLIKWLAQGAEITFDIGQYFTKLLTGTKQTTFQNALSLNILQPLFQGAGRLVAEENLVQSERNVVYQIRSFLRYQKSFSVNVAEKYFGIILARNNLENYWKNYQFLRDTRERIEMLSIAGRLSPLQADQAKQNEYRAYQQWIQAENNYKQQEDEFKIFLGLSPEHKIVLDRKSLDLFLEKGLTHLAVDEKSAIEYALSQRLDLMNASDYVYDAERNLAIAKSQLKSKIDFEGTVSSSTEKKSKIDLEFKQPSYSAGIDFDLPAGKISERNSYKQALINLDRKKRDFTLKRENIKLEILNSVRSLEEAYQSYIVQKNSLDLASRRVESTNLMLQAGRATTRDLLEAQESFLQAQNALSSAIVNYLVAYLNFLKNTEQLQLDDSGVWKGDIYEKITGDSF